MSNFTLVEKITKKENPISPYTIHIDIVMKFSFSDYKTFALRVKNNLQTNMLWRYNRENSTLALNF